MGSPIDVTAIADAILNGHTASRHDAYYPPTLRGAMTRLRDVYGPPVTHAEEDGNIRPVGWRERSVASVIAVDFAIGVGLGWVLVAWVTLWLS